MKAKFVKEITVIDPDSKSEVSLSVFKHERGGMFALDSSFIEQVAPEDCPALIPDPFEFKEKDNMYQSVEWVELTGI